MHTNANVCVPLFGDALAGIARCVVQYALVLQCSRTRAVLCLCLYPLFPSPPTRRRYPGSYAVAVNVANGFESFVTPMQTQVRARM